MITPDPGPGLTQRQQFLQAAADIREAFDACSAEMALPARDLVRAAYATLYVLGSHVPDVPAGSPLPCGGMDDQHIARALRHAENGMASPAVTLQLIAELRRLREELRAMGGPFGVTDDDIRSMLAEGFATAWRKSTDTPESVVIWKLIDAMDREEWGAVISFVADPLIAMLRRAEEQAQPLRLSLQPGQLARIETLAAVLEQTDGSRYELPDVADRAVRVMLHQLAAGDEIPAGRPGFTPGQAVEFRASTAPDAAWEPGTWEGWTEDGRAVVQSGRLAMWGVISLDQVRPAFSEGQPVEFRNRGAEWEPGFWLGWTENGQAHVQAENGGRVYTISPDRVRLHP